MPNKEAEAVNSLADQGVDVVTCHVDSPKVVIETRQGRKIYSCGYHANGSALAPKRLPHRARSGTGRGLHELRERR